MLAQLEVINMGRRSILGDKNQFVLGAVECAHASIRLHEYADVFQLSEYFACFKHFSDMEPKRMYVLADNRTAELAGWDDELLAIEFSELAILDPDLDLTTTGFGTVEVEALTNTLIPADEALDVIPEVDTTPAISKRGDLYFLDTHRLYCGDARRRWAYGRLLRGELAQMCWTDPPYNIAIERNVSGLGQVKHKNFAMGVGEMSPEAFAQFLGTAFRHMVTFSVDGSIRRLSNNKCGCSGVIARTPQGVQDKLWITAPIPK